MTRSKGPQPGLEPGHCSGDKASVHETPALPTELKGAPHHQILMFKLAPRIKWKGIQVNIDHFEFVYV